MEDFIVKCVIVVAFIYLAFHVIVDFGVIELLIK
jgi:hypothetical protein